MNPSLNNIMNLNPQFNPQIYSGGKKKESLTPTTNDLIELEEKELDELLDEVSVNEESDDSESDNSDIEESEDEEEDEEEEENIVTKKESKNNKKKRKDEEDINDIAEYLENGENDDEDVDDDDDDEDDEEYLKKFDENIKKNIIQEYHPELNQHNYEEIDSLTTVTRNSKGIIIDPLHKTIPFLSKYEKARVLGDRARQINSGAEIFVEVEPFVIDGYLIALKELEQKKIPFIIKRPLPNGGVEYWKLKDLEILV